MELTRADRHNNPAVMTVDLAKRGGLQIGMDYCIGEPFEADGHTHHVAKLLGNPICLTLRVIDKVGFYTVHRPRWAYIAIPSIVWGTLSKYQRILAVKSMYWSEGGTEMNQLFDDALVSAEAEEESRI